MQLEIAVDNLEDAIAAQAAGADRLELVSDLAMQGLTPPVELLQTVCASVIIPVVAMVRHRPGDFCYDRSEYDVILRQAAMLLRAGASGLVFGGLTAAGDLDDELTSRVVQVAAECNQSCDLVLHRAIDFTRDPEQTIIAAGQMGVTRVLTAGCPTWSTPNSGAGLHDRIVVLRGYRELAEKLGTLRIMPGGGVRPGNVKEIIDQTGCMQVHSACRPASGGIPCGTQRLDSQLVCEMRAAMAG